MPLSARGIEEIARDHPNVAYLIPSPLDGLPNVSYTLFRR